MLSNFAIYDAEVIEESQLESLIHDIPETVEVEADAMDDSAFTALFEEPPLYGLFHLEFSTDNDTSRGYSIDSDTSDEYRHEEAGI